jgi:hypothetical protein
MGSITRGLSNNITTGGVILPAGITNASVADVTSFANASGGTLILLSTQTASNSSSISFTSGLDSTYDAYVFRWISLDPVTNDSKFNFNLSTDGGSNYNVTKTTTKFNAYHDEADTTTSLNYDSGTDQAQETGFQEIHDQVSNTTKASSGYLELYNPSSTTNIKHFISVSNRGSSNGYSVNTFLAGYANTTSAINAIRFQMNTGNIDSVTIKLYGLKKS